MITRLKKWAKKYVLLIFQGSEIGNSTFTIEEAKKAGKEYW
jgi:hypothetical protein